MNKELKNNIIDSIKLNYVPYHYSSNYRELSIRCPYCGDSYKNSNHTHLYINTDRDDCLPYYCQRCTLSGIVDSKFLKDINIFDYKLMGELDKSNKKLKSDVKKRKKSTNEASMSSLISNRDELILPNFDSNNKFEIKKYNYIDSRYSFSLDPYQYIREYKVIFSFRKFIIENGIDFLNANEYMIKNLSSNYVGLLSYDNSYIIFRNIKNNCQKNQRYYMYNIFNDDSGKRFYAPKTKVNIMEDTVNLVLCEGPFDIIGIKEYFYKDSDNTIFVSVNGKGYNLIINHFVRLGFLNMNIFIYSDSDVPIQVYKYLKQGCSGLKYNKCKVIYNCIEKDFGVKLDQIQLKSNYI